MIDAEILKIRDQHLPSQGESFDTLAFGRAVAEAVERRLAVARVALLDIALSEDMTLPAAHAKAWCAFVECAPDNSW